MDDDFIDDRKPKKRRRKFKLEFDDDDYYPISEGPMTRFDQAIRIPEIYLKPVYGTSNPEEDLKDFPAGTREDLLEGLGLVHSMPLVIENAQESLRWDLCLFRLEMGKLTFGIPGEIEAIFEVRG